MLCYILYMKDMGEVLEKELIDNLLNKSEEAFLMAIEIYNKPTINYRLEGFTFFICNAWELLLKAKILMMEIVFIFLISLIELFLCLIV